MTFGQLPNGLTVWLSTCRIGQDEPTLLPLAYGQFYTDAADEFINS